MNPPASPVRDASRYGPPPPDSHDRRCPTCRSRLPTGRASYCSAACKQRAYRLRQGAASAAVPRSLAPHPPPPPTPRDRTIYACPECDQRLLGEQRCPDCHRFCRRLGAGGLCPHCDEPLLLDELLGKEVGR